MGPKVCNLKYISFARVTVEQTDFPLGVVYKLSLQKEDMMHMN